MSRSRFKVTPFEARTLSWWKTRRSKIDMSPPYQRRGRLWSEADKAYLVDSILNGFDVPKLYVADFTWTDSALNRKRLPYAIIDGKQRFEAIFDFFDGTVVLNQDFVFEESPELRLGGLSYKDLQQNHAEIAELFETYNLSVMSVIAENEEQINELFVRLNRSKPLTGAEIRNAMAGPAPEVVREIAQHELFTTSIAFSGQRGQDLNAAAKVLLFEYSGEIRDTKKVTLDHFVRAAGEAGTEKLELAGRHVLDNLDRMLAVFLPKDRLLASAGLFPVYYWLVRSVPDETLPRVREFLVRFEDERRESRRLMTDTPKSKRIVHELVEYDNYNRSTNDQASHVGRVRILLDRITQQFPVAASSGRRRRAAT